VYTINSKRFLQWLPRETGQRGFARAIGDLSAGVERQALELFWPGIDAAGIAQSFRVRAMPVRLAVGVLAVVAQQVDGSRAALERHGGRASATVAVRVERLRQQRNAVQRRVAMASDRLALERAPDLRDVVFPPRRIQREKVIGPQTKPEGRVGDYYFAIFSRFVRFSATPAADKIAVVCGEAGAAGNADNDEPAAFMGCGGGLSASAGAARATRPFAASRAAKDSETENRSPGTLSP
jgi:hypothetical protein